MPVRKKARLQETIKSLNWNGHTLKLEDTVELSSGDFLLIKSIIQEQQSIVLSGLLLQRNSNFEGRLPKKLNKVFFTHNHKNLNREDYNHSLEKFPLKNIVNVRELIRTNKIWSPRFRSKDTPGQTRKEKQVHVRRNGVLTARWKYIRTFDNTATGDTQQEQLLALEEEECFPPTEFVLPKNLRFNWPGPTICGGSENGKYSYGDLFCGAGGATCGAQIAGLTIMYGMDADTETGLSETWTKAFPGSRFYHELADDFLERKDRHQRLKINILHMSPPCQAFSSAHTRPGPNDEKNRAALICVSNLLKQTHPRVATLEETPELSNNKHKPNFHSLLQSFTILRFSISWQTPKFQDYGLPWRRERLVIIASCPGESLPDFPAHTHSQFPGRDRLKPETTPRSVISRIPANAPNNEVTGKNKKKGVVYKGWNDLKITKCIMCNGGKNRSHPTQNRSLTHRELAALQGFPNSFEFYPNLIRRQIGNAVPPSIAQVIFTAIREHLEKEDGEDGDLVDDFST